MASPITYKRLVLSGDKAKATADEVKTKMAKDWKKDFPDGTLDIKSGVEGKMVIDVKTKESSAASLASKIKDIATRNKVGVIIKDKPTLSPASTDKSTPSKDDVKNLSSKELQAKLGSFNTKSSSEDEDSDYDKDTVAKLFKTVGSTVKDVTGTFLENQDELVDKIKKSLMYQVGNPKGEPMSKGQKLPANTKMKKSELKEIIKNFNK